MSNTRRPRNARPPRTDDAATPVTRVRSPADILAIVPYLFGFEPHESVVVIDLRGPRRRFGPMFRLDLPAQGGRHLHDVLAAELVAMVRRHRFSEVVVAVFSSRSREVDPFVRRVMVKLAMADVRVEDAFRGDGQRWWSYTCPDPRCCDPAGMPYDVRSSAAAAGAVMAGLVSAPDREALRSQFEPGDPSRRAEVAREVDALRQADGEALSCSEVELLLPALLAGQELTATEEARWLISLCRIPQRDRVWSAMSRADAEQHLDVWRALMRHAPDELLAPVGSLTAFAAWLSGSGVLASHAVDRVLALHPGYSMAQLIRSAIEEAVDPRTWDSRVG